MNTFIKSGLAIIILFGILTIDSSEARQTEDLVPADTLDGWRLGWVANLNGSQASYRNWSKGGINSLSVVGSSQFTSLYRKDAFSYGLRIRTNFGQSRFQDEGVRKTDDRISVRNQFLYDLGEDHIDFSLFANINFETQFAEGYNYGAGPEGENILISNFMAPAYLTQNAGLAYIPDESFSIQAGLGLKQTIVSDTDLSPRYGLDEGDSFFNEAGFTFGITYEQSLMENVTYFGYVETFSNLNRALRRTDVNFSNRLVGRINDYLNMTFQFDLIYDDDFSDEVQLSQVLSAGLSIILF
jgi:hypothetical protein